MDGTRDLSSLIGSRICHDLISPLGAIGNGVELLSMAGGVAGPEMSLIAESVESANARIRFFRVAFGAAGAESEISRAEIADILAALGRSAKVTMLWQVEGAVPRPLAKLAFLCLQCLESAMPRGGRIQVQRTGEGWQMIAEAARLRDLPELWTIFDDPATPHELAPADLQFALAPVWARDIGYRLRRRAAEGMILLGFAPA